jgi:hypothetical protein
LPLDASLVWDKQRLAVVVKYRDGLCRATSRGFDGCFAGVTCRVDHDRMIVNDFECMGSLRSAASRADAANQVNFDSEHVPPWCEFRQ